MKQSTNLMLDLQINDQEAQDNAKLDIEMSMALDYVIQSRDKTSLYLITEDKKIIRT
jgi:hypothetical protein